MKTTLLFISALLFFGSCSNKIMLVKRKYNHGFYVSVIKKDNSPNHQRAYDEKQIAKVTASAAIPSQHSIVPLQETSSFNNLVALSKKHHVQHEKKSSSRVVQHFNHKSFSKNYLVASAQQYEVRPAAKQVFHPLDALAAPKSGSGNIPLIVMVILCFFPIINLIPVYIHDNKSITINFWLTLILTILGVVPGIVYALLVVLDLVDLR